MLGRRRRGQPSGEPSSWESLPGSPLPPGRRPFGFEWRSSRSFRGYPLVHVAVGRDSQGKWRVAKGIVAIGQFGVGVVTIAQFGIGLLFGCGQFILGFTALAQVAVGLYAALGQVAVGYVAVGQVVLAHYGLAQVGWAIHLWSPDSQDPRAVAYFTRLFESLSPWLPGRIFQKKP